jgi:hypothetical protein
MKKLIITTAVLVGFAAGAFAQGTIVFQNAISGVGGKVDNGVLGTLQSGTFTVELLYGAPGTAVANLTPGVIFTSSTGSGLFYDGATQTLPLITAGSGSGDATQNVEIAIEGWTGSYTSLAAAIAAGANTGITAEFTNPTGGGGSPAAAAADLVNWTVANSLVLVPVPEPSTIVLGGLGAAALLAFRRRK